MLFVSQHGLGINYDAGPAPKYDSSEYPDEPLVASDLSPVVQSQTTYTQALIKNVAGQLETQTQKLEKDVARLRKQFWIISACTGLALGGAVGLVLWQRKR